MRILFAFVGGAGHLNPLLPIARAARAAGHAVAFSGPHGRMLALASEGFAVFPTGTPETSPPPRLELSRPDAAHEAKVVRQVFAHRLARERAAALLPIAAEWAPDLIVNDEMDFGAVVAAERLGLPHASVVVIAGGGFAPPALISEPLNKVRAELGLAPDPDLAMLSRYLVLAPVPPRYRDPGDPLPATAHAIHPLPPAAATGDSAPPWLADLDEAPLVYLTLGTVFNVETGDLMTRLVTALRSLPINLVATVGREIDPAELGPQPPNVRIEQYVSQALLLPHCQLVISHGGSGTVIGALAHGLPQVILPLGADQLVNAARGAALGVARVLDVMTITPEQIRATVTAALADPDLRREAERFRDEIADLPGPDHAVRLLERLAKERRPLTTHDPGSVA